MNKRCSILPEDITPLTDFKRDTAAYIRKLQRTGRAQVLTVNGRAEVVVQSAKSYQKFMEAIEREATRDSIRQGLAEADRGELHPLGKALTQAAARRKARTRRSA